VERDFFWRRAKDGMSAIQSAILRPQGEKISSLFKANAKKGGGFSRKKKEALSKDPVELLVLSLGGEGKFQKGGERHPYGSR